MELQEGSRLGKIMDRRRFGMRPGLEVMRAVLKELGDPQNSLRFVHVAGTNGKGATCAIIDEVLRAAGYRVGRYTSPHLVTVNERFFLNGEAASDEALEPAVVRVMDVVERLERERGIETTFFEALTAVAFAFYAEAGVDVVVLETGLGGRYDATNVVATTLVSVITR
ncbi:MAG: bifunctional folylpolyglutamate synthase/dihydrofolate synthase, partial [Kiritimatiellae bacterium]|nr:bifunctional folylpolyglutamate synthase/dihydrofolate synthase [Kiritimatiellia bacterium]